MSDETGTETEVAAEDNPAIGQEEEMYELPLDDLRTKLEGAAAAAEEEVPEEEDEVAEEQAAPETDATETPVEEPETTPTTEEPSTPSEPPTDMEVLQARLDQQDAQIAHWKSLADRRAGEIGHRQQQTIEEQSRELAQLRQAGRATEADPYADPTVPLTQPAPAPPVRDDVTSWAIEKAIKDTGLEFLAARPEMTKEANGQTVFADDFLESLKATEAQVREIVASPDPRTAQRRMLEYFTESYNKVTLDRKTQHLAELERRKADQAENMRNKRRTSASASAGTEPARPTSKAVNPYTVDLDEMASRITEGRFT